MDGIEKITARIQADGQAELDRLKEDVRQQLQTIHTQTQDQVDRERQDILSRGEKAAAERLERLKSAAEMEKRKLALAAKQEVLSEAFDKALEQLCALPDEQYIQLLTHLVLRRCPRARSSWYSPPRTATVLASRWWWPPTRPW